MQFGAKKKDAVRESSPGCEFVPVRCVAAPPGPQTFRYPLVQPLRRRARLGDIVGIFEDPSYVFFFFFFFFYQRW